MSEPLKLTDRIYGAYQALRGNVPFPRGSGGQSGGYSGDSLSSGVLEAITNAGQRYAGTRINYPVEVGDLSNSTLIMSAVGWVSRNLADARQYIAIKDADNKEQEIQDHPLTQLLKEPNDWYSGETLFRGLSASWVMAGTAYIRKVRNALGQPIQYWWEPHTTTRPRWFLNGDNFIDYYEVKRDGVWYYVDPDDMIMFRDGVDPVTRMGSNGLSSLLRSFYTDNQAEHFMAVLLRHGLVPPVALGLGDAKTPGPEGEDLELIKQETYRRMRGDEAGKPLIFSGPVKVQKLGFDYSSVGMNDVREIPKERFCAVIGLHEESLRLAGQQATYNNVKMFQQADYNEYIKPLHKLIGHTLKRQALPDFGETEGLHVGWDYSQVGLLQPDVSAEHERVREDFKARVIDQAEARDADGYKFGPEHVGVYYPAPGADTTSDAIVPTVVQPFGKATIKAVLNDVDSLSEVSDADIEDTRKWLKKRMSKGLLASAFDARSNGNAHA